MWHVVCQWILKWTGELSVHTNVTRAVSVNTEVGRWCVSEYWSGHVLSQWILKWTGDLPVNTEVDRWCVSEYWRGGTVEASCLEQRRLSLGYRSAYLNTYCVQTHSRILSRLWQFQDSVWPVSEAISWHLCSCYKTPYDSRYTWPHSNPSSPIFR